CLAAASGRTGEASCGGRMSRRGEFRLVRALRRLRSRFSFAQTNWPGPAPVVEGGMEKSHAFTASPSTRNRSRRRASGGSLATPFSGIADSTFQCCNCNTRKLTHTPPSPEQSAQQKNCAAQTRRLKAVEFKTGIHLL